MKTFPRMYNQALENVAYHLAGQNIPTTPALPELPEQVYAPTITIEAWDAPLSPEEAEKLAEQEEQYLRRLEGADDETNPEPEPPAPQSAAMEVCGLTPAEQAEDAALRAALAPWWQEYHEPALAEMLAEIVAGETICEEATAWTPALVVDETPAFEAWCAEMAAEREAEQEAQQQRRIARQRRINRKALLQRLKEQDAWDDYLSVGVA